MAELIDDKQIKAMVNTPARSCLIQRDHVLLPFLAFDEGEHGKMIRLNRRHLTFLYNYGRDGMTLGDAATKAGMTEEQVLNFLKRRDVQAWLGNLTREAAIKMDWERPEKWVAEGQKVWSGEKKLSKAQTEVWKEFGKRFCPAPGSEGNGTRTKIEINIDPEAIERSRQRRRAIEAQIANSPSAA